MHTGMTSEELWDRFCKLSQLRVEIAGYAQDKGDQWENATDPDIKNALRADWDQMWREFRIVSAWAEIAYSAWTFCNEGADSVFMTQRDMIGVDAGHN